MRSCAVSETELARDLITIRTLFTPEEEAAIATAYQSMNRSRVYWPFTVLDIVYAKHLRNNVSIVAAIVTAATLVISISAAVGVTVSDTITSPGNVVAFTISVMIVSACASVFVIAVITRPPRGIDIIARLASGARYRVVSVASAQPAVQELFDAV